MNHLQPAASGLQSSSGPDPPGELVIEPCLDDATPDYDTEPDLLYAND